MVEGKHVEAGSQPDLKATWNVWEIQKRGILIDWHFLDITIVNLNQLSDHLISLANCNIPGRVIILAPKLSEVCLQDLSLIDLESLTADLAWFGKY